jgi:dephospho-CoA kinase
MARDQLTQADARRRIEAQLPLDEKRRRADYVIDTDASIAATDMQVHALVVQLRAAANEHSGGC